MRPPTFTNCCRVDRRTQLGRLGNERTWYPSPPNNFKTTDVLPLIPFEKLETTVFLLLSNCLLQCCRLSSSFMLQLCRLCLSCLLQVCWLLWSDGLVFNESLGGCAGMSIADQKSTSDPSESTVAFVQLTKVTKVMRILTATKLIQSWRRLNMVVPSIKFTKTNQRHRDDTWSQQATQR